MGTKDIQSETVIDKDNSERNNRKCKLKKSEKMKSRIDEEHENKKEMKMKPGVTEEETEMFTHSKKKKSSKKDNHEKEMSETFVVKKKRKKTKEVEENCDEIIETHVKKKKTKKSDEDNHEKEMSETVVVKKKRKKSKREADNTDSDTDLKNKKRKKLQEKDVGEEEETKSKWDDHTPTPIGVVDLEILQQASVNLGLPMVDEPIKDSPSINTENLTKKKKKKDKKEKCKVIDSDCKTEDKSSREHSLQYLKLWGSDRKSWKFNKHLQVRLMRVMYDKSKLSDEDFETLLLYLDGMQGKSRDRTRDDAGKIVKEETGDDITQERARQIFQMLS